MTRRRVRSNWSGALLAAGALALTGACSSGGPAATGSAAPLAPRSHAAATAASTSARPASAFGLVPLPSSIERGSGPGFAVSATTPLRAEGGPEATATASLLAPELGLPVRASGEGILLRLDPHAATGPEGYTLDAGAHGVTVTAADPAGLFYGGQTLRQLLPATGKSGTVPAVRIKDRPRYAYRGGMLDVARHFFPVAVVERYVDLLAAYKFNYLHLHLTDDQGWRIAISSRPRLTTVGAASEVGGGAGGYYTAADYRAITAYAAARHITVVPEVDLPGHSNAALASYPELGCKGDVPATPYTGTDVGFSRVCTSSGAAYRFTDEVVAALAALTPGPTLHIGGDEARTLAAADYQHFMARAVAIVRAHGKQPVAYDEAAPAAPAQLQLWHPLSQLTPDAVAAVDRASAKGIKIIMSPADRTYLDMKYDARTRLGLQWAGYISVEQAYDWDPDSYVPGLKPGSVTGVEAPLWTETLSTEKELQLMLLPRLPALAEVAWTPQSARDFQDFAPRLATQTALWTTRHLTWTPWSP